MTTKEKARELFDKYADEFNFDDTYRGYREQSKQCALIVVEEIIGQRYAQINDYKRISLLIEGFKSDNDFNKNLKHIHIQLKDYVIGDLFYWQEVKKEIENL